MAEKHFTVDEANRTLPLVRRIVADIVEDYDRWRDRMRRYEILSAHATEATGESEEQVTIRDEVDVIARRINGYIEELRQIGCVFKGFDEGLVDFHSMRDGREVLLCWKHGEPAVEFWHELDSGFAGRQPLTPETISEDAHG